MLTQKTVVARIDALLKENDMKLGTLATLSGVPPTMLKNIMYGNTKNPGIITIKKLCDGLGVSLNYFFDTDDFKNLEQELK